MNKYTHGEKADTSIGEFDSLPIHSKTIMQEIRIDRVLQGDFSSLSRMDAISIEYSNSTNDQQIIIKINASPINTVFDGLTISFRTIYNMTI